MKRLPGIGLLLFGLIIFVLSSPVGSSQSCHRHCPQVLVDVTLRNGMALNIGEAPTPAPIGMLRRYLPEIVAQNGWLQNPCSRHVG